MSTGGKIGGISFDHVLIKLQAELQRSRETGAELQDLTTAMTDIQDTLGGGLVSRSYGSELTFSRHLRMDLPTASFPLNSVVHLQRHKLLWPGRMDSKRRPSSRYRIN